MTKPKQTGLATVKALKDPLKEQIKSIVKKADAEKRELTHVEIAKCVKVIIRGIAAS